MIDEGDPLVFTRIRSLREDSDYTQAEIADVLNIRQTTYSKYELGKILIPIDMLIRLADFYHVSLDYLVGRSDDPQSPELQRRTMT